MNVSVRSRLNWNLEVLVLGEGKAGVFGENLLEQGREPTTNGVDARI